MSAAIGWEQLKVGECYSSNFEYMRQQGATNPPESEYLGELITKPVKEMIVEPNPDPHGFYSQSFPVWSADFKRNGIVSKRYQTRAPDGQPMLGFFFTKENCYEITGGIRKRRMRKTRHRRSKRTTRKH